MTPPNDPSVYIGVALVLCILSLSVSGVIAAVNHVPPDKDIMMTVTGMVSAMVGALLGRASK